MYGTGCRCFIVHYGYLVTGSSANAEAVEAVCSGTCPKCAAVCNCRVRFQHLTVTSMQDRPCTSAPPAHQFQCCSFVRAEDIAP